MKRLKRNLGIIMAAILLIMVMAGNPAVVFANANSTYRISTEEELKQLFSQMTSSEGYCAEADK